MRALPVAFMSVALSMAFAAPGHAASTSGTVQVTIFHALTVQKQADLSFGRVVVGSGTVEIGTNGTATYTGIAHTGAATSAADFLISGEGAQIVTVSLTAPSTLTSGANSIAFSVPAADESNIGSSVSLGGSIGSSSSVHAKIGGKITLTNTTVAGTYTGTLTVTANYN